MMKEGEKRQIGHEGLQRRSMNDNEKLIDTNILVYAYDRSEQQKHAVSKALVTSLPGSNLDPSEPK
jgi:hypothetical protein